MIRILTGDCRDVLKTLPDESVHCVVTSPPYWGLRDYGTATWQGGDVDCNHSTARDQDRIAINSYSGSSRDSHAGLINCRKCGARRVDQQIGLEPSSTDYMATIVEVFREVRRVLRKDGTLWLNLGDSYAGGGRGCDTLKQQSNRGTCNMPKSIVPNDLKPKDLCGIPWKVAFALQADGWWLRQDIIWSKPNPMPESVTDRCTKAHEYLFLLSKSATYYYDAEAIAEAVSPNTNARLAQNVEAQIGSARAHVGGKTNGNMKAVFNHKMAAVGSGIKNNDSFASAVSLRVERRNKRSVWEIATAPFSEAHFATFPPALIEPCILAGCPEKCCAKCGAPVVRNVERKSIALRPNSQSIRGHCVSSTVSGSPQRGAVASQCTTIAWSPTCSCNAETSLGVVLDPFGGAGTTGLVADRLGRNAILIELNPEYAAMAERRIKGDAPLFAQVETQEAAE